MKRIPALIFILIIFAGVLVVSGLVVYKKILKTSVPANTPQLNASNLPELPPVEGLPEQTLENFITETIGEKLKKEITDVHILQATEKVSKGTYKVKGDDNSEFIFIAERSDKSWGLIFNGKDDTMTCGSISKEIPVGIVPNCVNTDGV